MSLSFVLYILLALIFIGILVLGHELGHFTLAKINGVKVEEFSIGMGPKLFSIKGKETRYSIRAIPIGGYVKMLGEQEKSSDPRSFTNLPPIRRLSIITAGPFMYSAIKKDGRKLYDLARQGIEVERDKRRIEIFSLEILNINLPYIKFVVHCSKGTYIRSLCKDIGDKLGCGGIMSDLERTENGFFKKEDSVNLKDLNKDNINDYIKPIDSALLSYPRLDFSPNYKKILLNGVSISDKILIENLTLSQVYRVYIDESFIGLGKKEISYFKMIRLLV